MNPPNEYRLFAGIDWASEYHEVSVIDPSRKIVASFQVAHSAAGMTSLLDRLLKLSEGQPATLAVAIEVPRGAVAEMLLDRGFHVYSVNPKQLDRFRDRHTVAGAKDDRLDAFVLADSVRTDRECFRHVQTDDPLMIQLREFSRMDDELREEHTRLSNTLRAQIHRFFPALLTLCPAADEPWLWSLLEVAPTPARAARLQPRKIERLLSEHRIRRFNAEELTSLLRGPAIYVAPGTAEAAAAHIAMIIPRLRIVHAQRRDCEKAITSLLEQLPRMESDKGQPSEHRDADIILSLPGVGIRVAATVLSEASQPIRNRDRSALRAHSGTAPVTKRSGTKKMVLMRRACNPRLREALYHASRVSIQRDVEFRQQYATLRARGHSHGRALRSVADRMIRILFAMLESRTLYQAGRSTRVPARQHKEAA